MTPIEFFVERSSVLNELDLLKNQKSNLILNLNLVKSKTDYNEYVNKIGNLELKIADLEIQRNNFEKAALNLFSAINFFIKMSGNSYFYVALRALAQNGFSSEIKKEFFKVIKSESIRKQPRTLSSVNFFSFIINQYVENNYGFFLENLNKVPLFLFTQIPYSKLDLINLPSISVSTYPYYSSELTEFLTSLEKSSILKLEKPSIIPQENYFQFVEQRSKIFENKICTQDDPYFLTWLKEKIYQFSVWNNKRIEEWEKKIGIMNFFSTGEAVN